LTEGLEVEMFVAVIEHNHYNMFNPVGLLAC